MPYNSGNNAAGPSRRNPLSAFGRAQASNIAAVVRPPSSVVPFHRIVPPPPRPNASVQHGQLATIDEVSPGAPRELPSSNLRSDGVSDSQTPAGINRDGPNAKGFDCPIRAGPNGRQRCWWTPSKINPFGFPDLSRMREHIGKHGLVCTDCQQVFKVSKQYSEHRKGKVETGTCSSLNATKDACPYAISLSPDAIEAFIKRPTRDDRSENELWVDGYKALHPNWHDEGDLPSSSYSQNVMSDVETFMPGSTGIPHMSNPDAASGRRGSRLSFETPGHPITSPQVFTSAQALANQSDIPLSNEELMRMMDSWMGEGLNEPLAFGAGDLHIASEPTIQHAVASSSAPLTNPSTQQTGGSSWMMSRNPYLRSISDGGNNFEPPPMRDDPVTSGPSSYTRTSSVSVGKRRATSPQSTAPSSSASVQGQRTAMNRIDQLRTQVRRLETKLQNQVAENRTLQETRVAAEQANQKLADTLDQIENQIIGWELSSVEMIELDQRLNAMNSILCNIRDLVNRKVDGDDDTDMLAEPYTGTGLAQPP